MLHQEHESYKYVPLPLKNWVHQVTTMQEKNVLSQKFTFWKKLSKNLKKHVSSYDYFKTETSWTKKVSKSILETWNVTDVIVYIWFIKKTKIMQCKQGQF